MSPRAWLEGALLAAFFGLGLLAIHWREKAAHEARRADSAVVQEKVATGTAAIADKVTVERVTIIEKTEEKARDVEAIPSDDIPADVRSRWCGGLRYSACAGSDPDRPGELQGAVPSAQP